jgi:hypothetical protein
MSPEELEGMSTLSIYNTAEGLLRHIRSEHPRHWALYRVRRGRGKGFIDAAAWEAADQHGQVDDATKAQETEDIRQLFSCAVPQCDKAWASSNGLQYHIQVSGVKKHGYWADIPALQDDYAYAYAQEPPQQYDQQPQEHSEFPAPGLAQEHHYPAEEAQKEQSDQAFDGSKTQAEDAPQPVDADMASGVDTHTSALPANQEAVPPDAQGNVDTLQQEQQPQTEPAQEGEEQVQAQQVPPPNDEAQHQEQAPQGQEVQPEQPNDGQSVQEQPEGQAGQAPQNGLVQEQNSADAVSHGQEPHQVDEQQQQEAYDEQHQQMENAQSHDYYAMYQQYYADHGLQGYDPNDPAAARMYGEGEVPVHPEDVFEAMQHAIAYQAQRQMETDATMPWPCPFVHGLAPDPNAPGTGITACRKKFKQRGGLAYHLAHEHGGLAYAAIHDPNAPISSALQYVKDLFVMDSILERRVAKELINMQHKALMGKKPKANKPNSTQVAGTEH